jgi:hypothetical protein
MSDTISVEPPPIPVLVAKYGELQSLIAEIAAASSTDLDDVQVNQLVRENEKAARSLTFQGLQR